MIGDSFPTFDLDDDYVAWTGGDGGGSRSGFLGGAQVGFNRQVGRFVFGIEGDFAFVGDGDGDEVTFDYFHSQDFSARPSATSTTKAPARCPAAIWNGSRRFVAASAPLLAPTAASSSMGRAASLWLGSNSISGSFDDDDFGRQRRGFLRQGLLLRGR